MIWKIVLGLVLWTVLGITYFIYNLGNKNKKENIFERILMTPVLPIAYLLGYFLNRNRYRKN